LKNQKKNTLIIIPRRGAVNARFPKSFSGPVACGGHGVACGRGVGGRGGADGGRDAGADARDI